ncbi:MAG: hypothetical protein DRN96_06970 [Thermoproteota archaeon]|nr:MAG: hypothetical protein DRN96_06970 [Candidatus Korarchaeota archaeon]RLG55069.1 MAG: hypothetical protein DRN99_03765 [Candidatus Korarchaeota archaeon]
MKRGRLLAVIGVVIAIVVIAAGYFLVARPRAKGPIRIGVLAPLSPPGDYMAGKLIVRGAELAAKYVNEHGGVLGGRTIEIVVEDDSGTPEKGVAGYKRLVTEKKVVAVIGQYHSSVCLAICPIADQYGVPLIATQAAAAKITEGHYKAVFRMHAINPARAKLWLEFIKKMGWKKIAILAENTDYGIGLLEETKAMAKEMGLAIEIKDIVFDRGTKDFTPQLLDIQAWGADLVINIGVGDDAYLIIKQAYDIGLYPKVPMLASYDFPVRPEYWKNLGDKGNYMLFISYYHPMMKLTDLGKWFKAEYEKKYNEPPVYTAYNAFGAVVVVAQAIEQAGSADPAAIIKALETGTFKSWNSDAVTFPRGEGIYWHQWSPPMVIVQYTKTGQKYETAPIVFPEEMKTGEVYLPGG